MLNMSVHNEFDNVGPWSQDHLILLILKEGPRTKKVLRDEVREKQAAIIDRKINPELIPPLQVGPNSASNFYKRVKALAKKGLIIEEDREVRLTSLGYQVAKSELAEIVKGFDLIDS